MRKDIKNPGIGTGGLNRQKRNCVNGHPLFGKNIWVRRSGGRKERRCKTCSRLRSIVCRASLKRRLFELLGGKCAWPKCNIVDFDMLTLDHRNNDGHKYRIRGVTSGDDTYALDLLKREGRFVPFQMTDTIIPIRGEDYQLLFELVDTYKRSGVTNFRTLQGRISEWKRESIEPEQAIREAVGPEYYFALAYED